MLKKCPLFSFASFNLPQFIFNSQFLYEQKRKVCHSKSVCGIFHFRVYFLWKFTFLFKKTLWLINVIILFKIEIIENLPTLWPLIFKVQQEFNEIWWVGTQKLIKNWPGDEFLDSKNRSSESVSFAQKELLDQIFNISLISHLLVSLFKHPLIAHRCKLEMDKLTYSKSYYFTKK